MNSDPIQSFDTVFINCRLATMQKNAVSPVLNAALAVSGGKIAWLGSMKDLPADTSANTRIDCQNHWLLPGFVDCHTHLVWAGSRSNEFEMRLEGATYEQIANQGGGITSTVRATRKADPSLLYHLALKRITHLLHSGVATVEIKSGYGLDLETELKMLDVIAKLGENVDLHIEPTFLGAHTLPPEYKDHPDDYIDLVINTMLPAVKAQGIATAVDMFCERIAFSLPQTRKVLRAAAHMGFPVKLHAEQLSDTNGAAFAASLGALSCDHLEYITRSGVKAMADNRSVAVMLPGAFYYLKETQKPPVALFRELKVPMAVSTDLNPGSSPVHSILLALNMSCQLFGLTCEEALLGATINGAKALGLSESKGSLEKGKDADLVLWDIDRPADLCYLTGISPVDFIMIDGKMIHTPGKPSGK